MGCLGSRWLVGSLRPEQARSLRDRNGQSLWDAMVEVGCDPTRLSEVPRPAGWLRAFLELHIDQSPALAECGAALGIVTDIVGPTKLEARFCGEAGHAGTVPASRRRDAGLAAGHLVVSLAGLAAAYEARDVFITAGALELWPGSVNTIPGRSRVRIDLRCADSSLHEEVLAEIGRAVARASEAARVTGQLRVLDVGVLKSTHGEVVAALESSCSAQAVQAAKLISRAGHDARHLSSIGPVGMLLVRNPARVSHHPEESVLPEDLTAGLRVLADALERLDLSR